MQSEFLGGFAVKGLRDVFPVGDVAAHGGIPVERQQVLVRTALLEIDTAAAVDDVQVDHRVKRFFAAMVHEFPGGLGTHVAELIHDRQHFRGSAAFAAFQQRSGGCGIDQLDHGVNS